MTDKNKQALDDLKAMLTDKSGAGFERYYALEKLEIIEAALTAQSAPVDYERKYITDMILQSMKRCDLNEGEGGGSQADYARSIYADLEVRGLLRATTKPCDCDGLVNALEKIISGDCRKFKDSRHYKASQCVHGKYAHEDCENCISEFCQQALAEHRNKEVE